MPAMTDAYLDWCLEKSRASFRGFFERLHGEDENLENGPAYGQLTISVIDTFCERSINFTAC
jgi:hypothetical protein